MNPRTLTAPLVTGVLFVILGGGCSEKNAPAATKAVSTPAAALSPDQLVMQALDYFEPMYKMDAKGRVTHLRLIWRHTPQPAVAEIGKLSEMQSMDMTGSTLTDETLAQLKGLQKLRSFSFCNTQVTDEGLMQLDKLSSLQWVWVTKRAITQDGVDKLKAARPDMNIYLLP